MSDSNYSRRAAAMARAKSLTALPSHPARPAARPAAESAQQKSKRMWSAAWKKINAERSQQVSATAPDPAKLSLWRRALRRRD